MNRSLRLLGALIVVLSSTPTLAGARWTMVMAGDCADHLLLKNGDLFSAELARSLKEEFITPEQARERIGPDATLSPQEIRRQLEPIYDMATGTKVRQAEHQLQSVLAEIRRLPPGEERVALNADAEMWAAFVATNTGERARDEAFLRLLRIAPKYKLTDDLFSARVIDRFESLRASLSKRRTATLTVRSNQPGSEVFLDGVLVGKDPWTGKVEPGSYQLELRHQSAVSLRHPVQVDKELTVNVDMMFESTIHPNRIPCVNVSADEAVVLSAANKLGSILEVSEAAVVRIGRQQGETWISAMVISVPFGMKRREGALKLVDPTATPAGIPQLAAFVVTGEPQLPVVARSAVVSSSAPVSATERALSSKPGDTSWRRPVAYGLGGFGLVSLAGGSALGLIALGERAELAKRPTPTAGELPAYVAAQNAALAKGYVGIAALGVGALAVGTGAYLYFTDEPKGSGPSVSLAFAPGSVQVFGSF